MHVCVCVCVAVNSHASYRWIVNDITDCNSCLFYRWIVNDITDCNSCLFSVSVFVFLFWSSMCKVVCVFT